MPYHSCVSTRCSAEKHSIEVLITRLSHHILVRIPGLRDRGAGTITTRSLSGCALESNMIAPDDRSSVQLLSASWLHGPGVDLTWCKPCIMGRSAGSPTPVELPCRLIAAGCRWCVGGTRTCRSAAQRQSLSKQGCRVCNPWSPRPVWRSKFRHHLGDHSSTMD